MTEESGPMRNNVAELLAAEAEAAEQFSDEEDLGPSYAPRRPAKDPSQVYSVRIPVGRLEQLRQRAAEKGVPPSALMRQWIIERLDADEGVKRSFEAFAAAVSAVLQSPQIRKLDEALWMVARAEDDERVLVFQEKVFADEESADEEARSSGGVVIPLPVARDYRPGRKRAEA
jgi:hypothetical protein